MARQRRLMVRCKCRTHCTVWDPALSRFVGDGKLLPRATRDNHSRDDRRRRHLATEEPSIENPQLTRLKSSFASGHALFIASIKQDISILADLPLATLSRPLRFTSDPAISGEYREAMDWMNPNTGIHILDSENRNNSTFLRAEYRLSDLIVRVNAIISETDYEEGEGENDLKIVLSDLLACWDRLDRDKELHWAQQRGHRVPGVQPVVITDIYFQSPTLNTVFLLAAVMRHIYFIPRRMARVHLAGLRDSLANSGVAAEVIDGIPRDPRSITRALRIDPVLRTYVRCPKCYHITPHESNDNIRPTTCSHRDTPNSDPCTTPLYKEAILHGCVISVPHLKYHHQDFSHWLGRLLARADIERLMDSYPSSILQQQSIVADIWSATVFSTLKDCNGQPFFPGPGNEGRLVFGISVDSFETHGSKPGKTTVSSTGIWMVCYNLPDRLRYLPENIYLAGVLPGPHHASSKEINSYLQLIVDDVKPFWYPGVFFSRTSLFPEGRSYMAIIVPLICDSQGSRLVAGHSAPNSHNFCETCDIDLDDIDILNPYQWPRKDSQHLRVIGTLWKNATSQLHQQQIYESFGQRWTALFDLPYWDPVRFIVIDSMHALHINLLKHHLRRLFRLDVSQQDSDGSVITPLFRDKMALPAQCVKDGDLLKCKLLIRSNPPDLLYKLVEFHRTVLYVICVQHRILGVGHNEVIGTRWVLAQNIVRWRLDETSEAFLEFLVRLPEEIREDEGKVLAAGIQIILDNHGRASSLEGRAKDAVLSNVTERVLLLICEKIGLDPQTINRPGKKKKEPLWDAIISKISSNSQSLPILEAFLPEVPTPRPPQAQSEEPTDYPRNEGSKDLASAIQILLENYEHSATMEPREKDELLHQLTERSLRAICPLIEIDPDSIPRLGRKRKEPLWDAITTKILSDGQSLTNLVEASRKNILPGRVVLGQGVMQEIWADMGRTLLPSWVSSVPKKWKTTTQLNANQAHTVCTIHLPITLIRLWHANGERMQRLLTNYMDLVSATNLANMRITTPAQIQAYNNYIFRYMNGVQQLFADERIQPHQHLAMHIGTMLELFGPVHAHNAAYYERFIRFLRGIGTNGKLGESESTFLAMSARNANLRAVLADNVSVGQSVSQMIRTIQTIVQEDERGYYKTPFDQAAADEHIDPCLGKKQERRAIDDSHLALLEDLLQISPNEVETYAVFSDEVFAQGTRYGQVGTTKFRDSAICFLPPSSNVSTLRPLAAIIEQIFRHRCHFNGSNIFLAVRSLTALKEEEDIYRKYENGGFMCFLEDTQQRIIPVSSILCHCALTSLETAAADLKLVHVLPLDRIHFYTE